MSPKVSVVTVCYNSQDTIAQTIESVLSQTCDEYEYIIIDGASTDATRDIIAKYNADGRIRLVSEPDNGLYDAMNKGHSLAEGEYIIYMNSGDTFADTDVLKDMIPYLDGHAELVYGNVIRIKEGGRILERYPGKHRPLILLAQGKMMCHQSIFTRCDIMKQYGFDMKYSITADYDFLMRMVRDKRVLVYADRTISVVDNVDGISSSITNMDAMRQQDDESFKESFPGLYRLTYPIKAVIRIVRRRQERRLQENQGES